MKSDEKMLNIIMNKDEHRQLKNYCVYYDIPIKQLILKLLKKEGIIKDG